MNPPKLFAEVVGGFVDQAMGCEERGVGNCGTALSWRVGKRSSGDLTEVSKACPFKASDHYPTSKSGYGERCSPAQPRAAGPTQSGWAKERGEYNGGVTVRRIKTYVAQTGLVYQYYFVGKRAALDGTAATEYIFDVTADRKSMFAVSVFLRAEALEAWAAEHGRELSETEQYATAKMRLQQGFDDVAKMKEEGRKLEIEAGSVNDLLAPLDLS
jgi:hypothetical protein